MKAITITLTKMAILFSILFFQSHTYSQTSEVIVTVNWPSWSSECRVEIYDASATLISTIDNGYTACCDDSYSPGAINLGCLTDNLNSPSGTGYYAIAYDMYGDGWNGGGTLDITSGGVSVLSYNGSSPNLDNGGSGVMSQTLYFQVTNGGAACSPNPEINIQGLGTTIVDGDTSPIPADDTDFGNVSTIAGTNENTFTIQNTGSLPLTIGAITISGLNPGDFSITTLPAASVAASSSTTFAVEFDPTASGSRTAIINIVNNDSDENPYTFTVRGTGVSGPPVYTPYFEDFDSDNGGWTTITSTNDSWIWTNSFPTTELAEGGFWRNNSFNNYANNTNIVVQSPQLDFTNLENLRLSLDVKYITEDDEDGMIIQYSIAGASYVTLGSSGAGTNWYEDNTSTIGGDAWNGDSHSASPTFTPHSQFTNALIDLSNATFANQNNVRFRIQFESDSGSTDDGVAFDNFRIEGNPTTALNDASVAPANLTSNLRLWLKSNTGISATDGTKLTSWEDQAYDTSLDKEDASAPTSLAPTYRDNATRNMNYNPVADFNHNNTEYMNGKGGFFSQDYFVVFRSDDEVDTQTGAFSPGRQFAIGGRFAKISFHEDPTGLAMGSASGRYTDEILSHTVDSYPLSGPPDADSYGRAFTTAIDTYRNHPLIVNVKTNAAGTATELYKNGKRVDNMTGIAGDGADLNFTEFDNLSFLIGMGRSGISGRTTSQLNGMLTEVISYSSPNSAISQQKIQSYLAIKYGVTLQGTASGLAHSNYRQNDVDYIDSQGTVIWDTSSNTTHNYDIAGIGRDDASLLNQMQSKSQNDEFDVDGPTSGIITMALTDTYNTNNENIASNATAFNDREFLIWGNNNASLTGTPINVTVDMSEDIGDASLVTEVSFTAIPRVWKVNEIGGDVPTVEVSIPLSAIRVATPPDGRYLMFISATGVFDPTADYRVMTEVGGKLYADYDFDGTEYITFGWAPERVFERSVSFNGSSDYIDIDNKLNLTPTAYTISAWIKRDAADTGVASIVSKRPASFTQGYDFRILGNNRVEFYIKNGSNQRVTSTTRIPDDEWHQVAVTYDGTTMSLYIDGVLETFGIRTAPIHTNDSFFIGAAAKNTPTQHFQGNIDEVRVWNAALTEAQLRYIMNQEIEENATFVNGKYFMTNSIIPTKNDIASLPWSDLAGYYPMTTYTYTNTKDESGNGNQGALKNLKTVDWQTAPLPYRSDVNGDWSTNTTWLNGNMQTIPGTTSIVDNTKTIDWNIVVTNHNVIMDNASLPAGKNENRSVLGLIVESNKLTVDGDNATDTGNGLTVTHYLSLDGKIDLEGESQLIQSTDSDLDVTSAGTIEKDQQGTQDYFTYNYWSSPVGVSNTTSNNNSYTLNDNIFKDGSNPVTPVNMNFISGYNGNNGTPISIANYWIWKFNNRTSQDYASWQHVRNTGTISPGEGFTMKGIADTSGNLTLEQNYTIEGKPNNGDITLPLSAGNDYLIGNPYTSAIDANTFILDNTNTTGAIYYWEHFGGGTHTTIEYQGGYAIYNLSGGVQAIQYDYVTGGTDISGGTGLKTPGRFIPVAQGFFVIGNSTGTLNFNNNQRIFTKEGATSVFVRSSQSASNRTDANNEVDDRLKIRLSFASSNSYKRQLLVTRDNTATNGIDFGFDALNKDDQTNDMFWMIENEKFVIQGTNTVNESTILPLGIITSESGMNNFKIDELINVPEDLQVYLHDKTLDIYHNVRSSAYQIELPAGEYLERFEITFTNQALSIEEVETDNVNVYFANNSDTMIINNPNNIQIDEANIVNMLGQTVFTDDEITNSNYIELKTKNLSIGTYIINLKTEIGEISKKVLVN